MATSTLAPPRARTTSLYPHAHWYFLAAIVVTWIGFSHTYFMVLRTEPLLHHLHGALMAGWIVMLAVQSLLYRQGKLALHRKIGRAGVYGLLPAIVVCGCFMVHSMLQASSLPAPIVTQLAFEDLAELLTLPILVALAIVYARDVELHARYMSSTVVFFLPPAIARGLFIFPFMHSFPRNLLVALAIGSLIYVVLIADDARRGRIRAPYLIAGGLYTASGMLSYLVVHWAWWISLTHAIAAI